MVMWPGMSIQQEPRINHSHVAVMFLPNKLRRKSAILLKNYGDYQNFLLFLLATAAGTAKIEVDRIYNQLR
ncbi:MAG: hypothetical protein LH628_13815 [Microcoleus sp. CAN_BIN18]|nr:hypothetical protein [Microcoleus sp. CAN_BIN18]